MTIRCPLRTIIQTALELFIGRSYHILHLTAPAGAIALTEHDIPVVAHLEDVGALQHTIPDHPDTTDMLPILQIA